MIDANSYRPRIALVGVISRILGGFGGLHPRSDYQRSRQPSELQERGRQNKFAMKIPSHRSEFFAGIFCGEQLEKNLSLWGNRQGFWVSKNATRLRIKKEGTPVSHQGARGEGPGFRISAGIVALQFLQQRRFRSEPLIG